MPELPEVDTMVRDVRPGLLGRRIEQVSLAHSDVLRGVSSRRLLATLRRATVTDATRRAKHAVIHLGSHRLVIQPGMTGSLLLRPASLAPDERRYAVLRARLDSGAELVYRDVRRIGTIRLLDPRQWSRFDAGLGPEPLAPDFTVAAFRESVRRSRQAIKKVLMDQSRLAGVGNIYANEALFAAGLDPSRPADRLMPDEHARLYHAVRRILSDALAAEGTTVRDYVTGTGQPGSFQLALQVYEREGEPCRRCGTRLAGTHAIDQRITVFCWRCQR